MTWPGCCCSVVQNHQKSLEFTNQDYPWRTGENGIPQWAVGSSPPRTPPSWMHCRSSEPEIPALLRDGGGTQYRTLPYISSPASQTRLACLRHQRYRFGPRSTKNDNPRTFVLCFLTPNSPKILTSPSTSACKHASSRPIRKCSITSSKGNTEWLHTPVFFSRSILTTRSYVWN